MIISNILEKTNSIYGYNFGNILEMMLRWSWSIPPLLTRDVNVLIFCNTLSKPVGAGH